MTNNHPVSTFKYAQTVLKHLRDKFPEELNRMEEENTITEYLENVKIKTKTQLLFNIKLLNSKSLIGLPKNYKKAIQIIYEIIDEEFNFQKKLNTFVEKHRKIGFKNESER